MGLGTPSETLTIKNFAIGGQPPKKRRPKPAKNQTIRKLCHILQIITNLISKLSTGYGKIKLNSNVCANLLVLLVSAPEALFSIVKYWSVSAITYVIQNNDKQANAQTKTIRTIYNILKRGIGMFVVRQMDYGTRVQLHKIFIRVRVTVETVHLLGGGEFAKFCWETGMGGQKILTAVCAAKF